MNRLKTKEDFEKDLYELYERTKKETKYNPTRFLVMLKEYGALETAKKLINKEQIPEGYSKLWIMGRQDLTVEYHIINEGFEHLFDEKTIKKCKKILNS